MLGSTGCRVAGGVVFEVADAQYTRTAELSLMC